MGGLNMNDNNHRIKKIMDFLNESPNDNFLLHALALEHMKLENFEEAKNIFVRLLDINPNYIGSYYHLGATYAKLKNKTKAIVTYEEGIKIATQLKDFHSLSELRNALDVLIDDE